MRNTFDRFNGRHQDYQAARPSYAQKFLDWLGELYAPPERYTAADIGSGTGKLSAQLLAAGFRVCGVEPNPDMRGAAEALLGGDPRFSSSNGTDHDTGLPDRSVDMSQRPRPSTGSTVLPLRGSAGRILASRRAAVLVWNVRGSAPVNQALAQVFREHCPSFHGFTGGMGEDDPRIRDFFGGAYEKRRFPNPLTLDRDQFLRRCFSSSYALREGDADYEAFRAALEALFDTFASGGQLIQPNETVAYVGIPAAPRG